MWEDRLELLQGVLKLWHVHVRGEAYSVSASLDELLESDIHVATTQELEHHQYSEHCFPADPRVTPGGTRHPVLCAVQARVSFALFGT